MATLKTATNKITSFQPVNFEDGPHVLELKGIEDTQHEQYGAGLKWIWRLSTPDGEQIVDDRGFPFEFWQFTSASMGLNRKTGGPTEGRKNVEALIGRPLDEGEEPEGDMLPGRKANAQIILDEKERLKIVKISPIKKKRTPVAEEDEE